MKSNDEQINAATPVTVTGSQANEQTRKFPPLLRDNGRVRLGGQGPCFRPDSIKDSGAVRLGGQGPTFR